MLVPCGPSGAWSPGGERRRGGGAGGGSAMSWPSFLRVLVLPSYGGVFPVFFLLASGGSISLDSFPLGLFVVHQFTQYVFVTITGFLSDVSACFTHLG